MIEAWANGPVVKSLYKMHKGLFQVKSDTFKTNEAAKLTETQKETIGIVLNTYGDKSAQWLSDQTHSEPPWIMARKGLNDSERGESQISIESIAEYYGSLA